MTPPVYNWKERYQREGIEGLKDRRRTNSNNTGISAKEYLKLQKENEKLIGQSPISDPLERIHSSIGYKQVLNLRRS